jgi:hypothetical protein
LGAVKAVSAGAWHTCAIRADDSLACWGYNYYGQGSVPAGLGAVKAIGAGGSGTCAIKADDSLACWGDNGGPVPAGLGAVKAVSAGDSGACAIKADDSLACWGSGGPVPAGLGAVKAVSAGWDHTCAIRADGSLACWGYNPYGAASVPAGLGVVTAVSDGLYHTCAIKADGSLACWGSNDYGQTSVPSGPDTPQLTVPAAAATEGQQSSGQVAAFTDTDNQPVGDYSVTITWGDGQSSAGTVSQTGNGQYAISASHTYADEGSYPVSVRLTDADGTSAQAGATATVADASLSASGRGSASSPVATTSAFVGQVATLSDQNPGGATSDFTATITWGDGQSSAGTVSQTAGGQYAVGGSHSYAADGPYTVKVHVADVGGSSADATSYVVVYEYANQTGGSFVVGDQSSGPGVYFWGSQWAAQNPMSGGAGPSSFKGFAENSAQSCGQTFTARPGNGASPPATVPSYMAVAVSKSVSKSKSTISGTADKLVVVKTDPGYGPDPGSPGTGQVVATICG